MVRPFDCPPAALTLTRVTAPVIRFFTKPSVTPLVSPATRLVASEVKLIRVPSGDQTGL